MTDMDNNMGDRGGQWHRYWRWGTFTLIWDMGEDNDTDMGYGGGQ